MRRKLLVALIGLTSVLLGILLSVPKLVRFVGTILQGFNASFGGWNIFLTVLGFIFIFFGIFVISAGLKRWSFILASICVFVIMGGILAFYSYKGTLSTTGLDDLTKEDIVIPTGSAITVEIPMGSNTSQIADILYEKGVITNTKIFGIISKLNGFDGRYMAGTHYVSKNLDFNSLMVILTGKPESVQIMLREGLTYKQMVSEFVKKGIVTEDELNRAMKYEKYDYDFVKQIKNLNNREYMLEGYLFPDTYEFGMGADAKTVINVMLTNFNNKIKPEYYTRAKELGMTMDKIITLASIIERETNSERDMPIVSAVFHKRLKDPKFKKLESCATIQYIYLNQTGQTKPVITYDDTRMDNPYNTYLHEGLPPGPICNPGEKAILAALYPDEETNYAFFLAPGDGTTIFSKTYAEHQAAMKKYGLSK